MELTDTQLNYFVNNRLKLPKGKRAEYLAQVDHLIERFDSAANMKVEQAKQIVSKAIEELGQALERGHSETLRNYLAPMGRFHRDSLRNVILIASQNPKATRAAAFPT